MAAPFIPGLGWEFEGPADAVDDDDAFGFLSGPGAWPEN
jgi:hypothetical protein